MRFERLDFHNFKPFCGTESIEFDTDSEQPITLVCAKNDVGKTAVLDGIKFCLYGFEDGEEARTQCINRTAALKDSGETSVTMWVHHDGESYKIKRGHYFSRVDSAEDRTSENPFMQIVVAPGTDDEDVYINTKDEDREGQQDIDDAEDFVSDLLPEKTVQFFMFDGDRIQAFAEKLEDADASIRDAIEQILGIREIQNAINDLDDIAISYYDSQYNEASSEADDYKNKKVEREEVREDLDDLQEELEDIKSDLEEAEEELDKKKKELADAENLEELYENYIKARVRLYGVDEVPDAEETLDEETLDDIGESVVEKIRGIRIQQQSLYKNFGPAAAVVAADNLEERIPEQDSTIPKALRKTLRDHDGACLVCGQSFDADEDRVGGLDAEQEDCDVCGRPLHISESDLIDRYREIDRDATDDAVRLSERISSALKFQDEEDISPSSMKEDFGSFDDDSSDLEQRREQLESRIARLDNDLDNAMDETERQSLRDRRDQLETRRDRLLVRKGERQSDIGSKKEELNEIDDELDGMEGATEREARYKRLLNTSEQTQNVFQEAKKSIVDSQRRKVEKEASRLFLEMSNKSDLYEGLDIDKEYRLRIKIEDEIRDLSEQDPSQGARQIIAYAFNAAVARSTSWEAPFVIDTPTGRLDNEHKTKLFDSLPEFGSQIMILYQPREMNREDIVGFRDDDLLDNHYQITREEGSSVSTIEPMPEGEYTCGDD
jgi:DNA sulfur modification protein DndD